MAKKFDLEVTAPAGMELKDEHKQEIQDVVAKALTDHFKAHPLAATAQGKFAANFGGPIKGSAT